MYKVKYAEMATAKASEQGRRDCIESWYCFRPSVRDLSALKSYYIDC